MTEHQLLLPGDQPGAPGPAFAAMGDSAEPNELHPLKRVHNLLRGRYHWALILGFAGALIGGTAGWVAVQPRYTSTGMIEVSPTTPVLEARRGEPMYMFESFVRAQMAQLKSRRVVDDAMGTDEWQKVEAGRAVRMGPEEFTNALEIEHEPEQQDIFVKFVDRDPHAAMVATKVVIDKYMKIRQDNDNQGDEKRLQLLNESLTDLNNHASALKKQIAAIAEKYGTDDLQDAYAAKVQSAQKFEQALQEVMMQLAAAEMASPGHGATTTPATGPAAIASKAPQALKPEDVAPYDPDLRALLRDQEEADTQVAQLRDKFGEEYRDLRDAKTRLAAKEAQIRQIMTTRYSQGLPPGITGSAGLGTVGGFDMNALTFRKQNLQALVDRARVDALVLGTDRLKVKDLRDDLQSTKEQIKYKTDLINGANATIQLGGIVKVRSSGEEPYGPSNHKARLQLSVLGALFLGGLGFGSILLLGLGDRRLKTIDDARSSLASVPLLGILPRLPGNLADPQDAAIAAHCVHQIRTMVQIGTGRRTNQVIAITSPAAETGKTSLTLALGLSFAACGAKTLLIDTDLVGRGLSSRTGTRVRERLGQILLRNGTISEAQLEAALGVGASNDQLLGKVLVERGELTVDQLAKVLDEQTKTSLGLLDVCAGVPFDFCTTRFNGNNLSILPAGPGLGRQAVSLSPKVIDRIIAEARARYDVVLVDTGPVPGSLEGSMVAAAVDGVVLVVSQGEQRPLAEAATAHLRSVGARIAGLVFNRAEVDDIARSVYMSASREQVSRRDQGGAPVQEPSSDPVSPHLGPVASAVATFAPGPSRSANRAKRPSALPPATPTNVA